MVRVFIHPPPRNCHRLVVPPNGRSVVLPRWPLFGDAPSSSDVRALASLSEPRKGNDRTVGNSRVLQHPL